MENYTLEEYGEYYLYIPTDNEPCQQEAVIKFDPIVLPIFISIVVLLSLIGNILVLVMLGFYENLKSLPNCFMFNLALSDLIFTLGLPFWACSYIWSWKFGGFMCRSVNFVFSAGFHSSIVFLTGMTIQCYVAVVHRLTDWTKCHSFAVIPIIAWVVSFSAALPDTLFSEVMEDPTDPDTLYCEHNSIKVSVSVAYEQNIFLVVAFSVTSFCVIQILLTIAKAQTEKHGTVRLVFCMVVASFVSWAPYNIVVFLQTLNHHQVEFFTQCSVFAQLNHAFHLCRLLAFSHCCVNPVIYVFASTEIRNHLKALLQMMFQKQTNTELRQPGFTLTAQCDAGLGIHTIPVPLHDKEAM